MRKLCMALLICLPASAFASIRETAVLDAQNMSCAMGSITIHKALEKVPGVMDAKVDYDHKTATVKCGSDKTRSAALVKTTLKAGLPSTIHGGDKK